MSRMPAVPMARGKAPVKLGPPAALASKFDAPKESAQVQCPLCIEDMDSTDLQFTPCPCGYRICLFCYESVKEKCNSLCPGCRREYNKPEESSAPGLQSTAAPPETPMARAASPVPSSVGLQQPQPQPATMSNQPSTRPPPQSHRPSVSVAGAQQQQHSQQQQQQQQLLHHQHHQHHHPPTHQQQQPGLPSGATWATQQQQHQQAQQVQPVQQPPQNVVADDSAWPSLAAAAPPPVPQPAAPKQPRLNQQAQQQQQQQPQQQAQQAPQQPQQQQQHEQQRPQQHQLHQSQPRKSGAGSDTIIQDQVVPAEQPGGSNGNGLGQGRGASNGAAQVESTVVSTSVLGVQRSVHVSLPQTHVEPYPEATSMLSSINQAMRAGNISSKEAAAQLVALLKIREAQNGKGPSATAGKAPPGFSHVLNPSQQGVPAGSMNPGVPMSNPPGFGAVAPSDRNGFQHQHQPLHGTLDTRQPVITLSPLDQPINIAPIGRYQPIGTRVVGPAHAQQQPSTAQEQKTVTGVDGAANGSVNQGGGAYSLWGGHPGIHAGNLIPPAQYNPMIGVAGSSHWQGQQQQHHHHPTGFMGNRPYYFQGGVAGAPPGMGYDFKQPPQQYVPQEVPQGQDFGLGLGAYRPQQMQGGGAPAGAKAPPPGFGPPQGQGTVGLGGLGAGGNGMTSMPGSNYDPTGVAVGRNQPYMPLQLNPQRQAVPSSLGSYRPPLGTQF